MCKLSLTSNKGSQPTKIRKVENNMKTGKITAKLRDAVPVCLIVEGKEVKRYKNIELPDAIKEIEMRDFHFYIPQDGRITFQIHYEKGALPDVFPAPKAKMTRAEKAAAKAAAQTKMEQAETAQKEQEAPGTVQEPKEITALAVIRPLDMADLIAAPHTETAAEIPEENMQKVEAASQQKISKDSIGETGQNEVNEEIIAEVPKDMEIHYNVNGPRRKELAAAVGNFLGAKPQYMKAPTYSYQVGSYNIGRDGTLTGVENSELIAALAEQGFQAA